MDALAAVIGAMLAAGVYLIGVLIYRKIKKQNAEDQLRKGIKNKTTPASVVEYKMTSPENNTIISTSTFNDEDDVYDQIAKELETGVTDKGLWTRLFAECEGDERQTKVLYIKQRAERLIAAKNADTEQTLEDDKLDKPRVESIGSNKDKWATDKSTSSTIPPYDPISENFKRIERRTLTRIRAIYPSAFKPDSNEKLKK